MSAAWWQPYASAVFRPAASPSTGERTDHDVKAKFALCGRLATERGFAPMTPAEKEAHWRRVQAQRVRDEAKRQK
jgi:hypothetical protein